jgi:hypothetical protein
MTTRHRLAQLALTTLVGAPLIMVGIWVVNQRDRDDGFIGRWAVNSGDCGTVNGRSPMLLAFDLKRLDVFGTQCEVLKVNTLKSTGTNTRHSWIINARCSIGAEIQLKTLRLSLQNDNKSLVYKWVNDEKPLLVQRCQ